MLKKDKICALILVIATVIMGVVMQRIITVREAEQAAANVSSIDVSEIPSTAVTCRGSARGMDGDVVVEVIADENTIYSVNVVEHDETPGIGTVAVERLPGRIFANQSINVDAIASCTVTSTAIKNAVRDALVSAGIDPTPFEKEVDAAATVERTEEVIDTDVVIIGAGGAGLTAATKAAQEGVKVLVVEKMPIVGGNSLKATGGMNAAHTGYQEALGITDSNVQEFIDDTMRGGHDKNNIDLVTVMSEQSSSAIDWLTEIGAPLPKVASTGGTKHKYLHEPEDGSAVGPYLVEKLAAAAEKAGAEVMLMTEATGIITDGGKVVGITAQDEEHTYTINAKSVIIASGGFGANFELMASFNPALANAVTTNHAGATGDGILMAQEIGADTVDMAEIQLHPTVYQETGLLVSESVRSYGAVLVNTDGKRFTDDMSTRDAVSAAELQQPGAGAFIIFDQRIVDHLSSCTKYINSGITVQADTYEGLAKEMGLSEAAAANFVETMNNWNEMVANGEDTDFGRSNGMDEDLSTAPYYAISIAPGIHHTMGGVMIDTEAHVIDTNGNTIEGLFAAGEVTGGVHGGNRIGGNAVCDFVVFGRIAGQGAADYVLGK